MDLANSIRQLPRAEVEGTWYRHVPGRVIDEALTGQVAPSRWGSGRGGFPILFLGRPVESVVIEAYRHLVDPIVDGPDIVSQLAPRRLVTCTVAAGELPTRSAPDELWEPWPADPRLPATPHLRVVRPGPDDE